MSDTHEVNVVRVGPTFPHPNADKLELTMVGGYQVVIGKGSLREGDLAVYIQPDSVVPQTEPFKFIWEPFAKKHLNQDGTVSENEYDLVPEKRRRITVKRLRKEYSEGLLMPVAEILPTLVEQDSPLLTEGTDVSALLGVTRYIPEFDAESTSAETAALPKRKYPKTLRGWFYFALVRFGFKKARRSLAQEVSFFFPDYDVNALKNAKRVKFTDGEQVTVTEKIHGSNARYVFIPDDEKNPLSPGSFYAGSHHQWKLKGDNVWWNAAEQHPLIEEFCFRNPGVVLYAEVGPTQKNYRYGCENKQTFAFPFDQFDPKTGDWEWPAIASTAPVLYVGPYSEEIVKQFVDGQSSVPGAKHQREGIVIHSRERRLKLKVVSNKFYEGDSK